MTIFTYCNGTDGQISIPSLLRMDTKKFNGNDRAYLIDATCTGIKTPTARAASRLCGNVDVEAKEGSTVNIFQDSSDGNSISQSDVSLTDSDSNYDQEQTDTDVFVTNVTEKAAIEMWEKYKSENGITE